MTQLRILSGQAVIPMVNTKYEVWIVARDRVALGTLFFRNEGHGEVTLTIESGPTNDPDDLTAPATILTLNGARCVGRADFPTNPTTGEYNDYTRIRGSGPFSVEAVGENHINIYTRERPE